MEERTEHSERAYPEHWEADVVLRDGGTAHIRPIGPDDADRLVEFYAEVSDESKYYRFFAPHPRLSDRDVHRFTHHDYVDRVGLAAVVGGRFIATVRYDRLGADLATADADADADAGVDADAVTGDRAEVAFLVQDAHQGRGLASALLEHVAAAARERGIGRFVAEVLPANQKMIKVFTDAGYTQHRSFVDGVDSLVLDLEPNEVQLRVMREREHRAEARSVWRLLNPRSVTVVGAGRAPGGFGRAALRNLVRSGFAGPVYAVNRVLAGPDRQDTGDAGGTRGTAELEGVPVHPSVRDLPEPVDLAVLAVPAEEVAEVAQDCGAHGVQGIVVVSSGWADVGDAGLERQRALVQAARTYGMRVLGPNALGLVNTDPEVRLNASLAPEEPAAGGIGLFVQSAALGVAALATAERRGLALSSFVSAGNRSDVSGNDLLQYWEQDPRTSVVVLYLESFGNPRKFTRLARRLGRSKPVVVVKGGRHTGSIPPGHVVGPVRISDATTQTLFRQAGVVRVDTLNELWDVAELLHHQPLPADDRVAVVGNSASIGLLTHDACLSAGLRPIPTAFDTGTTVEPEEFRRVLNEAVDSPDSDAVIAVVIPSPGVPDQTAVPRTDSATGGNSATDGEEQPPEPPNPVGGLLGPVAAVDPGPLLRSVAAAAERARAAGKPLVLVHLALDGLGDLLRRHGEPGSALRSVPAYPAPERAARALGEAVQYARWRREDAAAGEVPRFEDLEEATARALVRSVLHEQQPVDAAEAPGRLEAPARAEPSPDVGSGTDAPTSTVTLDEETTARLLHAYGIRLWSAVPAGDAEQAVDAAARLGYPVALKTTAEHLRHRADLGGVRLELPDEETLRRVFRELSGQLGGPDEARLVVQAMAPRGVPTVVSAAVDPSVGAVLSFGLAGAPAELLGDVGHRLLPATDREVAELVRSIRGAAMLFGWRGADPVDTDALEDLLLRLSVLVHDLEEVARVDLDPVVVAPHGVAVLSASVQLAQPPVRTDAGPRSLRGL